MDVHTEQIGVRAADFGVHYWMSHHPFVVPEPVTLEPTESYSRDELDEYAAILARVAEEARADPEIVRTAPHNSTVHTIDHTVLDAIHPDDRAAVDEQSIRTAASGEPYYAESRMQRKDGEWIWVRDQCHLIQGKPGVRPYWHGS